MGSGQIMLFQILGGERKIEVRLAYKIMCLIADMMAEQFQRNL